MFTGIIESLGTISHIEKEGSNIHFTISSPISQALKVDQSIAHDGVCLTVTELIENESHKVTAIDETLKRTNLAFWKIGQQVNLERCMKADGRLDGHIVQGHVDTTAECTQIQNLDGSWQFFFSLKDETNLMVEKGSITINGTSLTLVDCDTKNFSVAIIPYTYEHTVFHNLRAGDQVNIEFDLIGKYISRMIQPHLSAYLAKS